MAVSDMHGHCIFRSVGVDDAFFVEEIAHDLWVGNHNDIRVEHFERVDGSVFLRPFFEPVVRHLVRKDEMANIQGR